MKNTELKRSRDKALYKEFRKGLSEGKFATMGEAAEYVCKQPAPQYFIEPKKASDIVGRILADVSLIHLNSCSRRRAWQLYRRYVQYMEEHPDCKMSRERVMEIIVEEPAPEFYIEAQRAKKILNRERKIARKKWEDTHA